VGSPSERRCQTCSKQTIRRAERDPRLSLYYGLPAPRNSELTRAHQAPFSRHRGGHRPYRSLLDIKAQAAKTPRSPHATWAPKLSSPNASRASTGKTSSTSGLSLTFADASDYDHLQSGDTIRIANVEHALTAAEQVLATVDESDNPVGLRHTLSERQIDILMAGGAINWRDNRQTR
jgi:hypothetical protein